MTDPLTWTLLALVSLVTLAGVRWTWVRVLGAILGTAVCLALLEMTPGAVGRAMTTDIAGTACAQCRGEILYPTLDHMRGTVRGAMLPITVLAIWTVVGDRWTKKKATGR